MSNGAGRRGPSGGEIRSEVRGRIGVLTLSQPDRLNALRLAMWQELPDALATLTGDGAVRAIVVRGDGTEAFSAGADISEFPANRSTPDLAVRYSTSVTATLTALAGTRKPTIAMLHGVCAGGAGGIAVSCSLRFADDRLRFSIPAARLGIVYEVEAIARLVETVGRSYAYDILISGRTIGPDEALRIGLVNGVVPRDGLESHVLEYAERVATGAPIPMEGAWLAIRATEQPWSDAWREELTVLQRRAIESADFAEGVSAFLEKRRPTFEGR